MTRRLCFLAFVVLCSTLVDGTAAETVVELRLNANFAMAPASVRGTIRVPSHPDNRLLRVTADSSDYYRSSDIQLEGESAPLSHTVLFRDMPAGRYAIEATVYGPDGPRGHLKEMLEIMGPER